MKSVLFSTILTFLVFSSNVVDARLSSSGGVVGTEQEKMHNEGGEVEQGEVPCCADYAYGCWIQGDSCVSYPGSNLECGSPYNYQCCRTMGTGPNPWSNQFTGCKSTSKVSKKIEAPVATAAVAAVEEKEEATEDVDQGNVRCCMRYNYGCYNMNGRCQDWTGSSRGCGQLFNNQCCVEFGRGNNPWDTPQWGCRRSNDSDAEVKSE